jgi:molybdopterin synthase catalytic subunit
VTRLLYFSRLAEGRVIELLHEPLSLERCVEAVRQPGSGGLVTFIGSVREVSEGKRVEYLEYEAYEPMALEKFEQVVREASERWPVRAMAIQHRLGRLEVGEDAVIVAVSTPHRSEAFAACQYAIDRLKEIVPIWKKEHGEGGEVWVGGPTIEEERK